MIHHDRFGARFVAANGEALAAWDDAVHAILTHGAGAGAALARCRGADPGCRLAAAVQGLALLIAGRADLVDAAHAAAACARGDGQPDARAEVYAAALADWLAGSALKAAARLESHAAAARDDVLAFKLAHQLRFMAGDPRGMARAAEAALAALPADHPGWGYVAGCAAFAREEHGAFAAAERLGRAAVARNPDDVWAIHAVAHAHEMTGRAAAGDLWLARTRTGWERCGNLRFHVWWHRALFALEQGRHDEALALYDTRIRAERTDDYRDVANAVSLLARLELENVAVGDRWQELAAIAARRIDDDRVVFARLHYLIALLRADRPREAAALIASLRLAAIRGSGEMDVVARVPGLALARGLQAFDIGRHGEAAQLFAAAAHRLERIGGSNAQRDLFERLRLESAIRAQRPDLAAQVLIERRRLRAGAVDAFAAARAPFVAVPAEHFRGGGR